MGPLIHRPTGCECRARHGLVLVHRLVQLPGLARSAWQHLTTGGGQGRVLGLLDGPGCHGQCHERHTYAHALVRSLRAGDCQSPLTP